MTADRMAQVDMAGPYYYADIVCLTTAGSAYAAAQGIADLAGGRCTAQSGTIWYDTCLPQIPDAQIQTAAETAPAMVMQLQTGAVDFVCTDLPTATAAAANDSDLIVLNFAGTDGDFQFASGGGAGRKREHRHVRGQGQHRTAGRHKRRTGRDDRRRLQHPDGPGYSRPARGVSHGTRSRTRTGHGAPVDQVRPLYLSGVVNTLLLAVAATVLGCLIGLACGLLNTIPIHPQDRLPRRVLLRLPGP